MSLDLTPPFVVHRPPQPTAVLYDSPHSGRYYPADFRLGAPLNDMRRGEDAYVDELLLPSVEDGATLLANNYPRCYIDVNRAESDIDESQLAEPWSSELGPLVPTDKSRRGLGLIRRFVVPGVEAQAGPLRVFEVCERLDGVYRPYHIALDDLVQRMLKAEGVVLHVDWHSMKSVGNAMTPDGPGAKRADFVVSDVHGKSADPQLTELIVETLRAQGYTVSVNDPYAGGTIVQRTGAPLRGVHSIQVEINRALYLDEIEVEKTGGFATLANNLRDLTRRLVAATRKP